ncbi:hypothetical protein NQ317_011212 [Molorchus minor]|uniref:Retrotransposon gag domain-containing protein n=1 Tax=Molorchus minor TaxID=1323400 RepID=A0ABQ9JH21_9CUCU|nr:hypothetical protein NQ317_011212 [Molorchus minor]
MALPPQSQGTVEPYKLSEVFSIIPEFDGNQINLTTFLNSCTTAYDMAVGNQKTFLTIHIKNKLKGRAAELINSRNPNTWDEIKNLFENHFGDTRDLSALIQDLQRMRQLPNEAPLTFVARLQTHEAKMHAAVQKQHITGGQKQARIQLTESMVLNTLLTGIDPKIGHVVRASDPQDILTAITRIRSELQLNYFENQKFGNRSNNTNINISNVQQRKPNTPLPVKQCSFCKRIGHTSNECRQRQQNFNSNNQNFPRSNNFQPNYQNGSQQRPQFQQKINNKLKILNFNKTDLQIPGSTGSAEFRKPQCDGNSNTNREHESREFQPKLELPRTTVHLSPLLSVKSKNLYYIQDATKQFKILIDSGAGLSIFKPETCQNYRRRSPENVSIQATEDQIEPTIDNPSLQTNSETNIQNFEKKIFKIISINPRTEQISKFRCNLVNTEAILIATEIEKKPIQNFSLNNLNTCDYPVNDNRHRHDEIKNQLRLSFGFLESGTGKLRPQ